MSEYRCYENILEYRFWTVLYLLAVDTSRTLDKKSCLSKIHASLSSIKGYFDPFNLKKHQLVPFRKNLGTSTQSIPNATDKILEFVIVIEWY